MIVESFPFVVDGQIIRLKTEVDSDPHGLVKNWLDECASIIVNPDNKPLAHDIGITSIERVN